MEKILLGVIVIALLAGFFGTAAGMSDNIEKNANTRAKSVILIYNVYDLQNMSKNLDGNYALANDINATITRTWNNGSGFVPIGNETNSFDGSFNGNGYRIINLYINSSLRYVGLFGQTGVGAMIENVGLKNISVTSTRDNAEVGGFVGECYGTVNDSYVEGSVVAYGMYAYAGGLIGDSYGTVNNSYVEGDVTVKGDDSDVGGLVGGNWGPINGSCALVNVTASGIASGAGGLVEWNSDEIDNSYVDGNVSTVGDESTAGGLVGENWGTLSNSYYDIDSLAINGAHYISAGGLFDSQYKDWFTNGMHLNIANYSTTLVPDGEYYDINSTQGLKDLLGFSESAYKFRLTANLSLSSEPNFYIPYFSGVFDGANHTISNLNINISYASEAGFFGNSYGTLRNIYVINGTIIAGDSACVGVLAGVNNGYIDYSYASGNISGDYGAYAGELVGSNWETINKSHASGHIDVSGAGLSAGGLVGNNWGSIFSSYSNTNVTVGGSDANAGGLVGDNGGTLSNSYATGNVTGDGYESNIGGLVGWNDGEISNTYAVGKVRGGTKAGGLIGDMDSYYGNVEASFWDINTTGQSNSAGGTGETTVEMKNKETYVDAGWNLTSVWNIYNERTYPFLRWEDLELVPTAPLNLKATSGGSWVNLTWLAPADDGGSAITTYLIYRGNGSANFTLFTSVNSSALCYNDTNVSSGNTYYYYVVAENAVGNSTASNQVNVTPQVGVTAPASPQNLSVVTNAGYVYLVWDAPANNGGANVTEYKIYRSTESGKEILIATVPATQLWYNDTSVSYGTTYYYYVDAVNSAGESTASNEVSVTVAQPVPELSSIVLIIVPLLAFMAMRKRRL